MMRTLATWWRWRRRRERADDLAQSISRKAFMFKYLSRASNKKRIMDRLELQHDRLTRYIAGEPPFKTNTPTAAMPQRGNE